MIELAEAELCQARPKSELVFRSLPKSDARQRQRDIAWPESMLGLNRRTASEVALERTICYVGAQLGPGT